MSIARMPSLPVMLVSAAMALALSACASPGSVPAGGAHAAPAPRQPVRQPTASAPRDPKIHMMPGLENVIGATENQLVRQFGAARLNVWEGDARKLQFTGQSCVLDIYLYPTSRSREPIATYVDARRASDGKDVDRASCVNALKR